MAFLVAPRIVLGLKCLGTLLVGHQEVGHILGASQQHVVIKPWGRRRVKPEAVACWHEEPGGLAQMNQSCNPGFQVAMVALVAM